MAVLGLRFCSRAFSSCGKRGPLFIAVRGPLTIAASLVAEHRLQTRRLSNYGSRAQLLRGMWDLPRPGLEPVSPALIGRHILNHCATREAPQSVLICLCIFGNLNICLKLSLLLNILLDNKEYLRNALNNGFLYVYIIFVLLSPGIRNATEV